jgi:nitroreductase
MLDCLVEGNRVWAQAAPVLILSVAQKNFKRNDKPNRHAVHDVGLAAGNLLLQAAHEGLYVHQMAGFDVEKARSFLEIPATHEPVAMMAMGYLGDPKQLPAPLQERELERRTRKPLADFIFTGAWNQRPSWLIR